MRFLRLLGGSVAWLVIGVLSLFASVYGHLYTRLATEVVRSNAVAIVNEGIQGRLEVGEIRRVSPKVVRLRGVSVFDPQGRRVAYVRDVVARPDLVAILGGIIRLHEVSLTSGSVRLIETQSGEPSIADAFESKVPSIDKSPGPTVVIEKLAVDDLRVRATYESVRELAITDIHMRAKVVSEDNKLELQLKETALRVARNGNELGGIEALTGTFRTGDGATSEITTRIAIAGDRVAAKVVWTAPDQKEGRELELDGRMNVQRLSASSLRALGFEEPAAKIRGTVAGKIAVSGTLSNLKAYADLRTNAGSMTLQARVEQMQNMRATIDTPGIAVHELVNGMEPLHVAGHVDVNVVQSLAEENVRDVRMRVRSLRVNEYQVASLAAHAVVTDEEVRLERVDLPQLGNLHVRGRYAFAGDLDVEVKGHVADLGREPNLRRLAPGLRGAVNVDARVRMKTTAPQRIDAEGTLRVANASFQGIEADVLQVQGYARGALDAPKLDVRLAGSGVSAKGVVLGRVDLRARGDDGSYHVETSVAAAPDRKLALETVITKTPEAIRIDARAIAIGLADRTWRGFAENIVVSPGRDVRIERLHLASGDQRLEARGIYRFEGASELEADVQALDVQVFEALPGVDALPVRGRLDMRARLSGNVEMPRVDVQGAWHDAKIMNVDVTSSAFYAVLDVVEGKAEVDAHVDLGDYGGVALTGRGDFEARARDMVEAMRRGTYDVVVDAEDLSAGLARAFGADDALPVQGRVRGRVHASGTLERPALDVDLAASRLAIEGVTPLDVRLQARYADTRLDANVDLADAFGPLGRVEGSLEADMLEVARAPGTALQVIESSPWRVAVHMVPRKLEELPEPLRGSVSFPARAKLDLTVQGGPGMQTQGDLDAEVVWLDLAQTGKEGGETCAGNAQPRFALDVSLRDGRTTALAEAFVGREQVIRAEAHADTPVDQWVRTGMPQTPPVVSMQLQSREANLATIPFVCLYAEGALTTTLTVNDLFGAQPRASLEMHSPQVRVMRARPIRLDVSAEVKDGQSRASVAYSGWSGERAIVEARLPTAWGGENAFPMLREDAPLYVRADFERAPVAPILAPVPTIGDADGYLHGSVLAQGVGRDIDISGGLTFDDVYISLVGSGQRLDHIRGQILFHRNWAELRRVRAKDADGEITLTGGVNFEGLRPHRARVSVRADDFPVRREGSIIASLSANASLNANIGEEGARLDLRVRDLAIALPSVATREVQPLEPHPDVVIVGEETEAEQSEEEVATAYPIQINVDATQMFWVRRQDFAVQLASKLGVKVVGEEVRITGWVRLRRGFLELMGKRFELRDGEIYFDGTPEVNPVVNIAAVHELEGSSDTVTVRVSGRLKNPEITFESSVPGVTTAGQVLELLAGSGRRQSGSEQDASNQAASFLTGVTAGILTLTARNELGGVMPVISIEAGDTLGSGKIRAGFDADQIIPDFLKGIVKGAYIEGYVSAGESNDATTYEGAVSQGGSGSGFLIELQMPHSLVTSATYEPTTNWSLDVTWEP